MQAVVMCRSPFLVRGLVAELGEHDVGLAATVASVGDLAAALARGGVDVAIVCLPGTVEAAAGCAHAVGSVMAEHPAVALLMMTASSSRNLPWLRSRPRWAHLSIEVGAEEMLAVLARLTATEPAGRPAHASLTLTAGEQRVLDLLAAGLSNDGIAHHLGVSHKTVETHVSSAFGKLGLSDGDHATNRRVLAALRWAGV